MTIKNRNFRTVLTALAVTTALPTMAGAQEADPSITIVAPVETTPPVTTTEPTTTVISDPLAPADIVDSAPAAEPTTVAAPVASATTPRRAPSPAKTARVAAPAATAPVVAEPGASASEPVAADPFVSAAVAEPVPVLPSVEPVNADASVYADLLPLAGLAGLGLIALAAIGMILRRRKRVELIATENHEPSFASTAVPAVVEEKRDRPMWTTARPVAVPAFSFGAKPAPSATGGNRIEQALRGPTPDNPFLSLKKRLKRAAFFDQRERQVRAGVAERVPPMAGLPRRMVEMLQGGVARRRYQMA